MPRLPKLPTIALRGLQGMFFAGRHCFPSPKMEKSQIWVIRKPKRRKRYHTCCRRSVAGHRSHQKGTRRRNQSTRSSVTRVPALTLASLAASQHCLQQAPRLYLCQRWRSPGSSSKPKKSLNSSAVGGYRQTLLEVHTGLQKWWRQSGWHGRRRCLRWRESSVVLMAILQSFF